MAADTPENRKSAKELFIDLSGASDAYLTVTELIDIKASGASSLKYKGDALIDHKDLSGASEIIKKDWLIVYGS